MTGQIADPVAILPVGLAAWHVLDVTSVAHHHLEIVLQHRIDRLPIDAGALHRYQRAAIVLQPIPQVLEIRQRRAEGAHLLARFRSCGTEVQAGHDRCLMHIQPGTALNDGFHQLLHDKGNQGRSLRRALFSLYHACSPLPGATKGNTLQAARVKLRGGVSKTTVEACDLERSHAEAIRFGPRRNARHHASTFSAMAVRPRPLANSVLKFFLAGRRHPVIRSNGGSKQLPCGFATMNDMYVYDSAFQNMAATGSAYAARRIISIVQTIVTVQSVVDIGCARGTWLREWQAQGVNDIVGVDGEYVDRDKLEISPRCFVTHDLAAHYDLQRRFDLAQSLEVAEHLPGARAASFVADLVSHAPVVLFSAAPPGQGGENHLNEQSYDYWRALFLRHDYVPIDCLCPLLKSDAAIHIGTATTCCSSCGAMNCRRSRPSPASSCC